MDKREARSISAAVLWKHPSEWTTLDRELATAAQRGGYLHEIALEFADAAEETLNESVISKRKKAGEKSFDLKPLTYGSPKTIKGEKEKKVVTGILYLAPHKTGGGTNVCPHASGQVGWKACEMIHAGDAYDKVTSWLEKQAQEGNRKAEAQKVLDRVKKAIESGASKDAIAQTAAMTGCVGLCLGPWSGRGVFDATKLARVKRTRALMDPETRPEFLGQIDKSITKLEKIAKKHSMKPGVRLNGTSDLDWTHKDYWLDNASLLDRHPSVMFYDYTKDAKRMQAYIDAQAGMKDDFPKNYHMTFSYDGHNWDTAEKFLSNGGNVAVVFDIAKEDKKPLRFRGFKVVDADKHDVRFADDAEREGDGRGVVSALSPKGAAKKVDDPFLVNPHSPDIQWPAESPYADSSDADRDEYLKNREARHWKEIGRRVTAMDASRWRDHVASQAINDPDFAAHYIEPTEKNILASSKRKDAYGNLKRALMHAVNAAISRYGETGRVKASEIFKGKISHSQKDMLAGKMANDLIAKAKPASLAESFSKITWDE